MNTSYQERNNWIELLITLLALIYYGVTIASVEGGIYADLNYFLPFVVKVTIASIGLGIVLAILNRMLSKDAVDRKDEMDKAIDLHGYRNAYWTMSGLIMVVIVLALLNERMGSIDSQMDRIETINLMMHSLVVVFSVGGLVQSVTQIFYYRRGLV